MQLKRRRLLGIIFLLTVIPLLLRTSITHAQTMFMDYTTGSQVFNIASSSVSVTLTTYKPDGSVGHTINDTIAGNQAKTYFPVLSETDFVGTFVASSASGNIVSMANLVATNLAAGAYSGQNTGATTVRLPLLMKNSGGYFSWYGIQNLGSSLASINVTYSDGETASGTIPVNGVINFFQSLETHTQSVFAAKITSNVPIIAGVFQENPRIMLAYPGFTDAGSAFPVFPLINANNAGYVTGVQLQNTTGSSTNVTVSYQPGSAGTACTETQTIPANGTKTFALLAFATNQSGTSTTCVAGQTFVGSAKVTSNSANASLTGVVNQTNSSAIKGGAYVSFSSSTATKKVVFPLIMDRNSGYYTGFQVQNVGTSTESVNCTFSNSSRTVSASLAPGQSLNDIQYNQFTAGYVGSSVCQSTNSSAKLVGVVNQIGSSTTQDQLLVYEGFNTQ